jgi:hypothetical protein
MTTTPGRSDSVRRHSRLAFPALAATLVATMPATAVAKDGYHSQVNAGKITHACYTQTNTAANAALVFRRNPDGTLAHPEPVQTGGRGIATTAPSAFRR